MTRLVVGVIGHVDHGKTTLVRALTGADTDRLTEEKRRGISIALGFAHLEVGPDTGVDLIDMPGHERFVRTMISGATGIDAVLLVVAANEGIKPQTVEHVEIAGLLGLRQAVVAISKIDLATPDQADEVADAAMRLLAGCGLDPRPPVMTSALRENATEDLRRALGQLAANPPLRRAGGVAFLPIDRAFSIAGHGPVVTGTLRGAAVSVGDTLELSSPRGLVRVRAVQVRGERVASAAPGQRVALNLRDIDIAELSRGTSLAAPGTLSPSDWLTISIQALEGAPPLRNGVRLRVMLGADDLNARLRLLDRNVLEAGGAGFAQLHFDAAVSLPAREHVVLRLPSPARTVAGGMVLEPEARRLRRNCPRLLERLVDLRDLTPDAVVAAEVRREAATGTTVARLARLSGLAAAEVARRLQSLPVATTRSGLVVQKAHLDRLAIQIPPLLAPHAVGLSRDRLLSALPGTSAAVLDAAIGRLLARGVLSRRGGQLVVPRPAEDQARANSEGELAFQIAAALKRGGLSPPEPAAVVTDLASRRAVERLLREGVIVRARDHAKGREILFHRAAIEDAQRRLAPLLERAPGLLVTQVAAALGISRKYCMPLLDHLDMIRFTRRVGDRRTRGVAQWPSQRKIGATEGVHPG